MNHVGIDGKIRVSSTWTRMLGQRKQRVNAKVRKRQESLSLQDHESLWEQKGVFLWISLWILMNNWCHQKLKMQTNASLLGQTGAEWFDCKDAPVEGIVDMRDYCARQTCLGDQGESPLQVCLGWPGHCDHTAADECWSMTRSYWDKLGRGRWSGF